ncbi:MAG TPA: PaaI family thioesterase [Candidatus Hydrogenedentes bacterium]|nr:PaaI family thioesterase [Candidatus Hydrogenedentota bacterium]HNT88791.1 PaaI family thioesterase [Candidatus Hydrogenedentota bacterium]
MRAPEDELYAKLRGRVGDDGGLTIPPVIVAELRPRLLDHTPGESIRCAFPAQERFANPMGMLQGGIIAAAFDFVFGMLAFLTLERPCASVTMNLTYLRPLPADGAEFTVEVCMRAAMRSLAFLEGSVCDGNGKTIATATTTMNVPRQET